MEESENDCMLHKINCAYSTNDSNCDGDFKVKTILFYFDVFKFQKDNKNFLNKTKQLSYLFGT